MKTRYTIPAHTFALVSSVVMMFVATGWAADGKGGSRTALTLARLSFWAPPNRMAEFETAYREKVAPILKRHGLTESSERGRATVDSVFSRLFELKSVPEGLEKWQAMSQDLVWKQVAQELAATFETRLQPNFSIYHTPAYPGKTMSAGTGKQVPAGSGKGHWRTYDVTTGLAGNTVWAGLRDRNGNLWFGTWWGGVSRYDGRAWTTFTEKDGLAENRIYAMFEDREGNLWFGTGKGVSRYDGSKWETFQVQRGRAWGAVVSIGQDREGNMWFGAEGGVTRYDGQSWVTFGEQDGLGGSGVRPIFLDRKGNLWFGHSNGVTRYDGQSFTLYPLDRPRSAFQDRDGNLWFGTTRGISRYNPSAGSGQSAWKTFTAEDGLPRSGAGPIVQGRDGDLWFGTNDGVTRYDGKTFTTFTTEDGLVDNSVRVIVEDREGDLWFGTGTGGVSRYGGPAFTTFTTEDGLPNNRVSSIFQDRDGNLWFGTSTGVSRYDGKAFTAFTVEDGLAGNRVNAIFQDRADHFWFSTGTGVSRYDRAGRRSSESSGMGTFTTFGLRDGLAGEGVWPILQDQSGVFWFGTSTGVSRYDGVTFTTFTTADGLARNNVNAILQDRDGNLWFGTYDGGVSRYDGQGWTTFTREDGLASNQFYWGDCILQDREGNLWFGTLHGISRYDGKTFTSFTVEDGLAGNQVYAVFQDREGHFWFGTEGGVSRYDGQVFQTLRQADGLTHDVVLSISQDREGNVWFGTNKGVTRYRPPVPSPPPVFVDAVIADRRYEKVSELAVPSTAELSVFEFHAISFKTRPEAMVYRYRLKGYDKDWKNTHARRVEYQDLPRGTYTFEVVAVDRDLVYSEKPATVALSVRMPFERIGWMSALGVALALIAYQAGWIIQRDRRLQEANTALSSANKELFQANVQIQEATRRKSAFLASMSHELRTPMNAIMGFTNLVLRRSGDVLPERQRENLVKVKQASDHLLSLINDILDLSKVEAGKIEVKPVRFGVRDLIASCCETVGPLARTGVALSHDVAGDVGEAHTDEARLRQIVINLLSNALKFTEKGEVRVSVVRGPWSVVRENQAASQVGVGGEGTNHGSRITDHEFLEIAVSDTGVGIPADALGYIFDEFRQVEGAHQTQKGTGLGLSITKKLTELLGGTISVESEMGKGSTFTVRVPTVYSGQKA